MVSGYTLNLVASITMKHAMNSILTLITCEGADVFSLVT